MIDLREIIKSNIVLSFFLTILITIIVAKFSNFLLSFKKQDKNLPNLTQINFLIHLFIGLIYIIGIGIAFSFIPKFRSLSNSLLASSGIFAIAVGFASQQAFANIVGGIFIIIFNPFKIGDIIKLIDKNIIGTVEDITLRHTVIRNFENKRFIIPNSLISSAVLENANFTENKVCKFFEIGIGFDSNIDDAIRIIKEEVEKHKDFIDNRSAEEKLRGEAKVPVRLVEFTEFSMKLKAWVWAVDNSTGFKMICDLNYSIKQRFDKAGILIPYPHRVIINKKDTIID